MNDISSPHSVSPLLLSPIMISSGRKVVCWGQKSGKFKFCTFLVLLLRRWKNCGLDLRQIIIDIANQNLHNGKIQDRF